MSSYVVSYTATDGKEVTFDVESNTELKEVLISLSGDENVPDFDEVNIVTLAEAGEGAEKEVANENEGEQKSEAGDAA